MSLTFLGGVGVISFPAELKGSYDWNEENWVAPLNTLHPLGMTEISSWIDLLPFAIFLLLISPVPFFLSVPLISPRSRITHGFPSTGAHTNQLPIPRHSYCLKNQLRVKRVLPWAVSLKLIVLWFKVQLKNIMNSSWSKFFCVPGTAKSYKDLIFTFPAPFYFSYTHPIPVLQV